MIGSSRWQDEGWSAAVSFEASNSTSTPRAYLRLSAPQLPLTPPPLLAPPRDPGLKCLSFLPCCCCPEEVSGVAGNSQRPLGFSHLSRLPPPFPDTLATSACVVSGAVPSLCSPCSRLIAADRSPPPLPPPHFRTPSSPTVWSLQMIKRCLLRSTSPLLYIDI